MAVTDMVQVRRAIEESDKRSEVALKLLMDERPIYGSDPNSGVAGSVDAALTAQELKTQLETQKAMNQSLASMNEKLQKERDSYKALLEESEKEKLRPLSLPVLYKGSPELPKLVADEMKGYEHKAGDFILSDSWEGNRNLTDPGQSVIIDLAKIDITWIPRKITVYRNNQYFTGLKVTYTNGQEISRGSMVGTCTFAEDLTNDKIRAAWISSSPKKAIGLSVIDGLWFVSNKCRRDDFVCTEELENRTGRPYEAPAGYSLRGFWSQHSAAIDRLGLIWGRDSLI